MVSYLQNYLFDDRVLSCLFLFLFLWQLIPKIIMKTRATLPAIRIPAVLPKIIFLSLLTSLASLKNAEKISSLHQEKGVQLQKTELKKKKKTFGAEKVTVTRRRKSKTCKTSCYCFAVTQKQKFAMIIFILVKVFT